MNTDPTAEEVRLYVAHKKQNLDICFTYFCSKPPAFARTQIRLLKRNMQEAETRGFKNWKARADAEVAIDLYKSVLKWHKTPM